MAAGDASDKVIVVIFPDGGRNYLSKLYNDEWLRINGLLGLGAGASASPTCCATATARRDAAGRRPGAHHRPRRRGDRPCSSCTASARCPCRRRAKATRSRASSARQREGPARPRVPRSRRRAADRRRGHGQAAADWSTRPTSLDDAFALLSGGAPAMVVVHEGAPPASSPSSTCSSTSRTVAEASMEPEPIVAPGMPKARSGRTRTPCAWATRSTSRVRPASTRRPGASGRLRG